MQFYSFSLRNTEELAAKNQNSVHTLLVPSHAEQVGIGKVFAVLEKVLSLPSGHSRAVSGAETASLASGEIRLLRKYFQGSEISMRYPISSSPPGEAASCKTSTVFSESALTTQLSDFWRHSGVSECLWRQPG